MIKNRHAFLFSVGIDTYSEFRTLSYCCADAKTIDQEFGERLQAKNRVLATSQSDDGRQVTVSALRGLLETIGKLGITENDIVMFYFGGHGFSVGGRDYFVCTDTRLKVDGTGIATDTAISTDDVIAALMSSGAGTAILIVDACRTHLSRDVGRFGEATAEFAMKKGTVVFFGCSPGQTCNELPSLGHGVFTYALLEVTRQHSPCTPIILDPAIIGVVRRICNQNKLGPQEPYTCIAPLQKGRVDIFTGEPVIVEQYRRRECLLIAGPSNAGKTTLGQNLATKLGMVHVEMSSFAYQRFQRHKKERNFDGSIQDFMEQVVWISGQRDAIAKDLLLADPGADRVVICGPRTVEEVRCLMRHGWNCKPFFLYAHSQMRFSRYQAGPMERYSLGYREFIAKDMREYGWGLARTATLPEVKVIVNEGELDRVAEEIATSIQS